MYRVALLVALTAGSNLAVAQGPSFTEGGIPDNSPGGTYWLSNYRDAGRLAPVTVESTAPRAPSPQPTAAAWAMGSSELIPGPRAFVGPVRINLRVPANAEVRIDGSRTTQGGEFRQFVSPAIQVGRDYHYEVRAVWNDGGRMVERARHIIVHAGDLVNLDLTAPSATAQR